MKFIKPLILIAFLLVVVAQVFSQVPPDPGGGGPGPVPVPLDGGLLLALLAGGSITALFAKKKKEKK